MTRFGPLQPPQPPEGQTSPLTPSDIKQMPTVTAEAGRAARALQPPYGGAPPRTDAEMEREEAGRGVGEAHVGPPCPQLSEPANDSSQGGCCKGSREIETDASTPELLHVWLRAAIQNTREPNVCRPAQAPLLCLLMRRYIIASARSSSQLMLK